MPGKLLFKLAKSPLMGKVVGLAFQYCAGIIPVQKVYKSKAVLAFFHSQPSYPDHMILSPRKPVRNLQQMSPSHLADIWEAAQHIQKTRFSHREPFVLIANGGRKQEVQQVHFHLLPNQQMVEPTQMPQDILLYRNETLSVLQRPAANGRFHFVLTPENTRTDLSAFFTGVLQSISSLDARFSLVEKGYSLLYQHSNEKDDMEVFHIVSGQKRT